MRAVLLAAAVVISAGACEKDAPATRAKPLDRAAVDRFTSEFPRVMLQCAQLPAQTWFDMALLANRVAAARPELLRLGTRKQLAEGLVPALPKLMCGQLEPSGSYKLVGVRTVGAAANPVFRIDDAQRGIDYHEVELTAGPDGRARIADIFIASRGEALSVSLADQFAWISKSKPSYDAFIAAAGRHDADEIATIRAALPEAHRGFKIIALSLLETRLVQGGPAATAALEEHYKQFPDDVGATMLELEVAISGGDGPRLLALSDRLAARFGADAWLMTLRSIGLMKAGRREESVDLAAQAAEKDPALLTTAKHLVGLYLANDQFTSAVAALERARTNIPAFDESEFAGFPTWAAFTQTPEYAAWKQRAGGAP